MIKIWGWHIFITLAAAKKRKVFCSKLFFVLTFKIQFESS